MLPKAHPDDGGPIMGGGCLGGDDPFAGLDNGFDEAALNLDNLMDCDDDEDDCEDDMEDGEDESDEDGSDDILYRCDLCSQRFQLLDFLKHQGPKSIEYQ